jgi:hypothetical protein
VHPPAETERPDRAKRGLNAKPLRSVYTLVVVASLLLVLGVASLSGRGDECKAVAGTDGTREQVCLGQFPDHIGDFFR